MKKVAVLLNYWNASTRDIGNARGWKIVRCVRSGTIKLGLCTRLTERGKVDERKLEVKRTKVTSS